MSPAMAQVPEKTRMTFTARSRVKEPWVVVFDLNQTSKNPGSSQSSPLRTLYRADQEHHRRGRGDLPLPTQTAHTAGLTLKGLGTPASRKRETDQTETAD